MPRIKPTNTYTPRVKPTTVIKRPRKGGMIPFSFDSTLWRFDSTEWTWDMTEYIGGTINSIYTRPRKQASLSLADSTQYLFADGEQVLLAGGNKTNIIQTKYK